MSKYKKAVFIMTFGITVLLLLGCFYGYYNYKYFEKWQTEIIRISLRKREVTYSDDKLTNELGEKRFRYKHLFQIYCLSAIGIMVLGTCLAFSIDLIKKTNG